MTAGTILGTVALIAVTVALGVWIDRKHSVVPKPSDFAPAARKKMVVTYAAGEAPATAIRARAGQLDRLRGQRCGECRAELRAASEDTVRYDGRELLVLRFACPACSTKRSLYVEPVA